MDKNDGTDWSEMDLDDLRSVIENGGTAEEAAEFLCRSGTVEESDGSRVSWADRWRAVTSCCGCLISLIAKVRPDAIESCPIPRAISSRTRTAPPHSFAEARRFLEALPDRTTCRPPCRASLTGSRLAGRAPEEAGEAVAIDNS
jgi:hypothetical protein